MNPTHTLKCWPDFFQAISDGRKTFEFRRNDRGFQAGDRVVLKEYDPSRANGSHYLNVGYTGREITAEVGYVMHSDPWSGKPWLDGFVVFSLLHVETHQEGGAS